MEFRSQILRPTQASTTLSLTVTLSAVEVIPDINVIDKVSILSKNQFHFKPTGE